MRRERVEASASSRSKGVIKESCSKLKSNRVVVEFVVPVVPHDFSDGP